MAAEPRLGVGVAILRGDQILLIRRLRAPEAGAWSLPGGKVDFLEPVETAARREIAEELGIALGDIRLLCVTDQIHTDPPEHWVAPVYVATAFTGEPVNLEPEKHGDLGWFDLETLPEPVTIGTRQAVKALLEA